MTTFIFAPIVEGFGEVEALRGLIEKIWISFSRDDWPQILRPIRQPKGKLVHPSHLEKAVELAALKLRDHGARRGVILLLIDADDDCAAHLGPRLHEVMVKARSDIHTACCIANVEYETWFVASAESMRELLELQGDGIPADPEGARLGKAWVSHRFAAGKYRETVDQPRLTARIDVAICRARSPSFDKLCREIEESIRRCEAD